MIVHPDQVERLESEIRQFRKHSGGGEQSFIREIQMLGEHNRNLEKAVGNSEKQLIEERRNNDQLSGKLEQLERQNKELKREVEIFISFLDKIFFIVDKVVNYFVVKITLL